MSNQQQFARRPQTIFNDFRYPMPTSDKPVEGAKYPARWTWEFGANGNSIFFKVNDGNYGPTDKNAKSKEVELSFGDRGSLFTLIENALNDVNFTKSQYHVKKKTFGPNGRLNDHASTLATFTVIRSAEGKIMVGYTKGTYKVMFPFTSPFESTIMVSTDGGEPREDHGLMSRVYCKAFIDFSRKFLDEYEFANYKPREKKGEGSNTGGGQRQGGNQNWGGNNSQQSGGGNNWQGGGQQQTQQQTRQVPADFDDEIDF